MISFSRVYRTVTRCCAVFNNPQKSGVILNWKWAQAVLNGSNIRFVSRNVNCSNLIDHHAAIPVLEKTLLCQHLFNPLWVNMKTKQIKCKGDSSTSSKKKKHKDKKKKSKRKSKNRSKLTMAASKFIPKDDDSSDSDILVVFEAKKPPQPVHKVQVQVEEILLDDDNQSCPMNPVSLVDIPLPRESCDSLDLAMIPLPQEEHLPHNVRKSFTSYINIQEKIATAEFRDEVRADAAPNHSVENIYGYENEATGDNARVREIRSWENTFLGNQLEGAGIENDGTVFSVMSYNVLAQRLLEDHKFLYSSHDVRSLTWEHRSRILLNEFRDFNADVLCLQEVQFDHLEWYNDQLTELGYIGLFKRRTHDHVDGCAIYFKQDRFRLIESSSVEYYQPGVQVLDRDNVALIARLEVVGSDQQLVVATTHLLFNPKRHDIKLAQMQLLLAELERIAYLRYDYNLQKPVYRPVIITGDFNLQPNSAVYRFITDGFIDYSVLSARTLQPPIQSKYVQRSLLPRDLQVSNTCQHVGILQNRQNWRHESLEGLLNELRLLKPFNSDNVAFIQQYGPGLAGRPVTLGSNLVNNIVPNSDRGTDARATSRNTNDGNADGMEPGMLSHNFHLKSVYRHFKRDPSSAITLKEASTHQSAWVTVDYIFYSGMWNQNHQATVEGSLKLLSRFSLPTVDQCIKQLQHIPNMACGSDHLPLLARFLLR